MVSRLCIMAAVSRAGPWSPGGNSWSKWQVAVVIGAPLAVAGVSYWYYKKSGKIRNRNLPGSPTPITSKAPSAEGVESNTLESIESMIANERVIQSVIVLVDKPNHHVVSLFHKDTDLQGDMPFYSAPKLG